MNRLHIFSFSFALINLIGWEIILAQKHHAADGQILQKLFSQAKETNEILERSEMSPIGLSLGDFSIKTIFFKSGDLLLTGNIYRSNNKYIFDLQYVQLPNGAQRESEQKWQIELSGESVSKLLELFRDGENWGDQTSLEIAAHEALKSPLCFIEANFIREGRRERYVFMGEYTNVGAIMGLSEKTKEMAPARINLDSIFGMIFGELSKECLPNKLREQMKFPGKNPS